MFDYQYQKKMFLDISIFVSMEFTGYCILLYIVFLKNAKLQKYFV